MEDILRAIALGIVQGLTEFFPVSSSGHLILTRELFGWEFRDDLTLDVALHLGTTVAIVAFFWRQWVEFGRSARICLFRRRDARPEHRRSLSLLILLVFGSLPVAIVGITLGDFIEHEVRSPVVVAAMLILFAVVLFVAERFGQQMRSVESAGWRDIVQIGLAQAIALVPGVSRSGVTISAGLGLGFKRAEAARLSFLLATPAIVGAGLLEIGQAVRAGVPSADVDAIAFGVLASAVAGWLSIIFLLRLVQGRSYLPFVVYRIFVGLFALSYFLV